MSLLSFPSKTFLLGEYAVLEARTALLLGHGPWFEAEIGALPGPSPFHPESPAGRWLAGHAAPGLITFRDPHGGAGGFGGSGAEFLAAWCAGRSLPTTAAERATLAWAAWDDSRAFPGSGADILTQAYGVNLREPLALHLDLAARSIERLEPRLGATLSLFHTGRKAATHEALAARPAVPARELAELVARGTGAAREGDRLGFARAISLYARLLEGCGLVAPHSLAALRSLPGAGVLAAKGCGAMGADVILVLHEAGAALDAWASANSLAKTASLPV